MRSSAARWLALPSAIAALTCASPARTDEPAPAEAPVVEPEPAEGSSTVPEKAPPPEKHRYRNLPEPDEGPAVRHVTLSWLPIPLLLPMLELGAEVRVSDGVSLGAFGGYGTAPVFVDKAAGEKGRRAALQVGGQLHYYVSGAFDLGGVHVGALLQLTQVQDQATTLATAAVLSGWVAGPFVGFKLVTRSGFTFDSQIGVGVRVAKTSGAPNDGDQVTTLVGNLGAGWTF